MCVIVLEITTQDLKNLGQYPIAILPDFFLDILIDPNTDLEVYLSLLKETYSRNGGNILGSTIGFLAGGNAGNVAQMTNTLGINTYFIGETSTFGRQLVDFFFKTKGIHCLFTDTGDLATSVILEFKTHTGRSNIMSSYPGSVKYFGPDHLTKDHWEILKNVRFISITNFQNQLFFELVDAILKNIPVQTISLIDFSDLTPHKHRSKEIQNFFFKTSRLPDFVLANENEILCLYEYIFGHRNDLLNNDRPQKDNDIFDAATTSALALSQKVSEVFFCLHTAAFVAIFKNSQCLATVTTHKLPDLKRATGSGDAWHAGFIAGLLLQAVVCRQDLPKIDWNNVLAFSNFVATYWMTHTFLEPLDQILRWGEKNNFVLVKT